MSIEIECLRRWLNEIADRVVELEDKVQDLETKTASDLSQSVVAEAQRVRKRIAFGWREVKVVACIHLLKNQ